MIKLDNLEVCFVKDKKEYTAVKEISYKVESKEVMGLVGESGCGKSISSLALMGLLPANARIKSGSVQINDNKIDNLSPKNMKSLRGETISMIFQEPMTALNPLMTVGKQIEEAYRLHHKCSRKESYEKTLMVMKKVGLSRIEKLYNDYPHQLSGGMCQRIVIAIALVNEPEVIIADEPTTALDVTIQAQILDLMKKLNEEVDSSIIFISHNLAIIKELCDTVAVMYAGYIVEQGKADEIFRNPQHPYTVGLINSIPTRGKKDQTLYSIDGMVPNLFARSQEGCCFVDRCKQCTEKCRKIVPELRGTDEHMVRCHLSSEVEK